MSTEWSGLYAALAADIAGYLYKITGDREVASDLLQETFVRAIRSYADAGELRSARAWLFRVAANLARDHRRRRALLRFIPFSGREPDPAQPRDGERDLIERALRALPHAQATALLLHYEAGFSRKEIAEMDGVSEEAVKSRLARGREAFAERYEQMGGRIK